MGFLGFNKQPKHVWRDEARWLLSVTKGKAFKQDSIKLGFNAFVYHIWKTRIEKIFNIRMISEEYVQK